MKDLLNTKGLHGTNEKLFETVVAVAIISSVLK